MANCSTITTAMEITMSRHEEEENDSNIDESASEEEQEERQSIPLLLQRIATLSIGPLEFGELYYYYSDSKNLSNN
jgi:hypothetical protein